jgi:transcriptional regulator with GAF, ATPase, and Fis domain
MDTRGSRLLRERQVERVGGSRAIAVDVSAIAATNKELSDALSIRSSFASAICCRLSERAA